MSGDELLDAIECREEDFGEWLAEDDEAPDSSEMTEAQWEAAIDHLLRWNWSRNYQP